MELNFKKIKISEIFEQYRNSDDEEEKMKNDAVCYGGKLIIRPKYQREFVYRGNPEKKVINSILKNYPLNIIYWLKRDDGLYELLDGQQRILSICRFLSGKFSVDENFFKNLKEKEREQIKNYELMIYECIGSIDDRIEWFETINITGEKLTNQEILNANISPSEWLEDAKQFFHRKNRNSYLDRGKKYLNGKIDRQEWLEKVLKWKINENNKNISIKEYMNLKKDDINANDLKEYFRKIIDWIESIFIDYREEQKKVEWGILYNKYKDKIKKIDKEELKNNIDELYKNPDVKKEGIYEFIFSGDSKLLDNRKFDNNDIITKFHQQNGICNQCNAKHDEINSMEADHIKPYSKGGKSDLDNLQLLCKKCNREKSNKWIEEIKITK